MAILVTVLLGTGSLWETALMGHGYFGNNPEFIMGNGHFDTRPFWNDHFGNDRFGNDVA